MFHLINQIVIINTIQMKCLLLASNFSGIRINYKMFRLKALLNESFIIDTEDRLQ